jgi:hypothetical protein
MIDPVTIVRTRFCKESYCMEAEAIVVVAMIRDGTAAVPGSLHHDQDQAAGKERVTTRDNPPFSKTTMNQQGPPSSASNTAFLPPPRQDMEYLCAGEDHASTVVIVVLMYQRLRCQK